MNSLNKKTNVIYFIMIVCFIVILFRSFYVMIISYDYYNEKVNTLANNLIYGESSPRGRILDRNGKIIVDNKAVTTIIYKKNNNTSYKDMIRLAYNMIDHLELDYYKVNERMKKELYLYKYPKICNKLISEKEYELFKMKKITNKELENMKLERISLEIINNYSENDNKVSYLFYLMRAGYSYTDKVIKSNASDKEIAYICENITKLEGFNTKVDWVRYYPNGDLLKSILGSVSSSSQGIPVEDIKYYLDKGYSLNDGVGLSYLEKEYENFLKGKKAVYRKTSSNSLELVSEGIRGNDVILAIDLDLQQEIEKIISEEIINTKKEANTKYYDSSSVIVSNPNTGEILAFASKKEVNGVLIDNSNSMLISPITPGSVVKGASILVGYNEGAIKIGERLYDTCIKIDGAPKKCSSAFLGVVDDIEALAKSSNVYQFLSAIRVNGQEYYPGIKLKYNLDSFDKYRKMYHSFGLGVSTGIDLPVESIGYSSSDKNMGNLLDFVMGQYETYTPLQLSQYINTIASKGYRFSSHLLKEVRDFYGNTIYKYNKNLLNKVESEEKYFSRMQEGLSAVMKSGGYGYGYIDKNIDSSGKTGTSQSFIDTNGDGIIDTETITSSFVGYMPSSNPKVSFMVTSPNVAYPNANNSFMSLVSRRIMQKVSNKYIEMYEI